MTRTGDLIRVVGPIAVETVTVTYQVTIKAAGAGGNNLVGNALKPDTPQVTCTRPASAPRQPADHRALDRWLDDSKTVDPASGSVVTGGDVVTFTLHFTNSGTGAARSTARTTSAECSTTPC